MIIDFQEIRIKNFLTFEGEFTVSLKDRGPTLIAGVNKTDIGFASNRSGKSNFIEAIHYGICGSVMKDIKVDEVINWNVKKDCEVEIVFGIGENGYSIIRSRKSKEYGSGTTIFKNGDNITPREASEQTKLINSIFGSDPKELISSMFFTSSLPKFIQSKDKLKVFEKLIRLENFESSVIKARTKRKETESNMKIYEENMKTAQNDVNDIRLKIQAYEVDVNDWEASHSKTIANLEYKKSELASKSNDYEKSKKKRNEINSNIESKNQKIQMVSLFEQDISKNEALKSKKDIAKNYLDSLNKDLESAGEIQDSESLMSEITELGILKKKHSDVVNSISELERTLEDLESKCPTENSVIDHLNNELEKLKSSLNQIHSSECDVRYEESMLKSKLEDFKSESSKDLSEDMNCKHCGSELGEEERSNIQSSHEENIKKIKIEAIDIKQSIQTKKQAFEESKLNEISALEQSIKDSEEDIESKKLALIEENKQKINNTKKMINEKKESLNDLIVDEEDLFELKRRFKNLTEHNIRVQNILNSIDAQQKIYDEIKPIDDVHIKEEKAKLEKEIEDLEVEVPDWCHSLDEINEYSLECSRIDQELNVENSTVNPYKKQTSFLEENLIAKNKQLKEAEDKFCAIQKSWQQYEFWEKNFRKVRVKLFQDIVPLFNEQLDKWCNVITGGDFVLNFDESLKPTDDSVKYNADSGGGKQRLDLCCQAALLTIKKLRSSQYSNLMIFDEWAESLDEPGIEGFNKFIEELGTQHDSIFVVSHDSNIKQLFENQIIIRKELGASRILP
jgi:DNA repair exonuclease SbcCD ATPase subunit